MAQIDRVGSFRGKVVDRGIGESSGGFPQAILQLEATELWDAENGVWVPWAYEEVETIAYLILFGKNGKPTLSARQLMKSLGWDGVAFLDIQENDKLNGQIQWRMEESTYEGNTTIRCQWIDHYDAVPGKKVQKIDRADIQRLQAKFAGGLQTLSGGPKPKAAPPKAAPKATPKADPTPVAPPASTSSSPVSEPQESSQGPSSAAPEPPAAPSQGIVKPKKAKKPKAIDMGSAWEQCYAAGKDAGKTDVEVSQVWTQLVMEAGGNESVGDDWSGIKAAFDATL